MRSAPARLSLDSAEGLLGTGDDGQLVIEPASGEGDKHVIRVVAQAGGQAPCMLDVGGIEHVFGHGVAHEVEVALLLSLGGAWGAVLDQDKGDIFFVELCAQRSAHSAESTDDVVVP